MPPKTPQKTMIQAASHAADDIATEIVVQVPQPAEGSYDPSRPLSKNTLLFHQVRHFQLLEQTLPRHLRSGHEHETIHTEGDAAEYLRKMTAKLHPQGVGAVRARVAGSSSEATNA